MWQNRQKKDLLKKIIISEKIFKREK